MQIKSKLYYLLIYCGWITFGCQTEFIPANINTNAEYVVEGYIEYGDNALPPYVILTKSRPFFKSLSIEELNTLFIKNAIITINDGNTSSTLNQVCFGDVPIGSRQQFADLLGVPLDSLKTNICVYADLFGKIKVLPNKNYDLTIRVDNDVITASTMIPPYVPLDSIWVREAPGKPSDTLVQLYSSIHDPAGVKNFYRYQCGINSDNFITPFNSVYDDPLIDGIQFDFRLIRPKQKGEDFDQKTFGLFTIGDSVAIKWSTIDEAHFNFWNTYEFNKGNQGPFSSYTTINTNIHGGLGVWGGYNSRVYRLKVKRK